jgi:dolichol-phosphate mannosyltransferase
MLLSIVCPAYEEEQVLGAFHAALSDAIAPLVVHFQIEIVYVDDGSSDRTFDVIRDLAKNDSRVRGLSLSRNFGHQAALSAGLANARGDAIVMLDTDMQHPPTLIPALVDQWRSGFDVVQTIRADDSKLSWFKRISSRFFYRVMGYFSDVEIRPAAADFRLMSRRALDALLQMGESHRFLRGMVRWLGFRVAEIPFEPQARQAGVSKYTLRKMLRLAFDGLYSFSRAPLRLAVTAGFAATCLSLLASLLYTWAHGGGMLFTCLLLAVHLVPAALFAAIGVVGEYVWRIHEECKRRPLYVVKAETPEATGSRRKAA